MKRVSTFLVFALALVGIAAATLHVPRAFADEAASQRRTAQQAVEAGLAIVQKGAHNYPNHRACFSCHHQTLPLVAMTEAREQGYKIDEDIHQQQTAHTLRHFSEKLDQLKSGNGIGGRSQTVSYGLWTLDVASHKADESTEAMIAYLLQNQEDDGRWKVHTQRPPMAEGDATYTMLAAYYMQRFATDEQREQVDQAAAKAKSWLAQHDPQTQEDRNFQLWGLYLLGGEEEAVADARRRVLAAQRDDGGWAQRNEMQSDAYATGQTLFILQETGFATDEEPYRRGMQFLLDTQQQDGSWFVETRAKPVQVYFDNGDPHGKSQFISIPATAWAVAALAVAEPQP